jgi:hypothetical protein
MQITAASEQAETSYRKPTVILYIETTESDSIHHHTLLISSAALFTSFFAQQPVLSGCRQN